MGTFPRAACLFPRIAWSMSTWTTPLPTPSRPAPVRVYIWDADEEAWIKRSGKLTDTVVIAYGQPNKVWATPHDDGIIRSTDGGKTWQDASTGLTTFGGMANLGFDPRDNSTLYGIIRPKYAGNYLRQGTPDGHSQTMPTPLDNATIETGMTVDGGTGTLYVTTQVARWDLAVTQSECLRCEGCQVGTRSRLRAGRGSACWPRGGGPMGLRSTPTSGL